MIKTTDNPDTYLDSLDSDVQSDMIALDKELKKVMSGLPRNLWKGTFWGGSEQNIIGYGDVVYKRPRGKDVEWFIVGLAVQKNYISVYVNAVEGKQYLTEKYANSLGKAKVGKSSISFKRLEDIDLKTLLVLVARARELMQDL